MEVFMEALLLMM